MASHRARTVSLEFNPEIDQRKGKALQDGLSAAVQIGNTLWVANDETVSLERLSSGGRGGGGEPGYGGHTRFALGDYLRLPEPPRECKIDEVDVEGLDYGGGYLWLVGSHSFKRKAPRKEESTEGNAGRLAKVSAGGNRFLLARIPVVKSGGTYTLEKEAGDDGERRTAAQLRGDGKGNDLTRALRKDEHLGSFLAARIPGKDNGFDVEGLAAAGERVFVGLRGPVLRGWAAILELALEEEGRDASTLKLRKIGPGGRRYRKHFLDLGGLGIRDLCAQGADLLILAGPSMDLDGPAAVFRWEGGAQAAGESLVFAETVRKVADVPFGKGDDHPEAIALFAAGGGAARSLLVVYDAASKSRKAGGAVKADLLAL